MAGFVPSARSGFRAPVSSIAATSRGEGPMWRRAKVVGGFVSGFAGARSFCLPRYLVMPAKWGIQ